MHSLYLVAWQNLQNVCRVNAGSCYAFAAAGCLEALVAINREANVTSELSEAQLVDCLPDDDVGCDSDGNCDGCQGGMLVICP